MQKTILWGVVAGLAMTIIGFLVNIVFGTLYPNLQALYEDTAIFIAMDSMRSLLFWVYPFVLGIALAWVFPMLRQKLNTQNPLNASLRFAWIYFVIAALPAFFINLGSFNLPIAMIASWTVMSFLNGWAAGFIFVKWLR